MAGFSLGPISLAGDHVRLEPLGYEHAEALLAAANESRTHYGLTIVPSTRAEMNRYLQAAFTEKSSGDSYPFAVLDAKGAPIGTTRYMHIETFVWPGKPPPPLPVGPDAVEIGSTWYAERAQRTAVNSECKLLLLGYAFETLRVRRVNLNTDSRNARSRQAIMRLGAKLDGILRCHRAASDNEIRHTATFSMLADEWPENREKLVARLSR